MFKLSASRDSDAGSLSLRRAHALTATKSSAATLADVAGGNANHAGPVGTNCAADAPA